MIVCEEIGEHSSGKVRLYVNTSQGSWVADKQV